jgi:protoheme ferro-lyase
MWRAALALAAIGGALVWWMNRDTRWDANSALVAPGSVREPRVGLVIVAIETPSRFDPAFWQQVTGKILDTVVPWPINQFAKIDRGTVLMDPSRPFAQSRFVPTRLASLDGREVDAAGVRWIDRARRGEIEWVEPNDSIPNDTGYFLAFGTPQGMPTVAAKTAAKARFIYHGALENAYLPHGDQTRALARDTLALLRARHPQIVAAGFANVFDKAEKERVVNAVLDRGVDVLVLGSGQPIYSDFEEMRGSYSQIREIVAKWREQHGNRPVRIAVAPWMATERGFDDVWLDHFAATVPPATAPGQAALGIVSLHGLPASVADRDSWSKRWPAVSARLEPQMAAILKAKGYATVRTATASEAFADSVEDPANKLVSVNELFREARAKRYALAIALPIEFLAENTDTLFAHQALFLNGIAGYRTYAAPPKGIDWSRPYVRRLRDGDTTIIYAGSPGGVAQPRASAVLADAIGRVFPPR